MPRALPCAAALLALLCASAPSLATTDTALAPRQTVVIHVGQWDPIAEAYTAWDSVGGEFTIGPAGALTVPLAGTLDAAGHTPEALAAQLVERLRSRLGLRGDLQASVTLAADAPIYVIGDVRAPGEYAHAAGMNVLQALGVAGGLARPGAALLRGERDALTALGSYRVHELELLRRTAALARLEAEAKSGELTAPPALANSAMGAALLREEAAIMAARRSAFEANLAQIDALEALLVERIERLNAQAALRTEQLDLLQQDLENTASLVARGLATTVAETTLQRRVADQQVRLLEVETTRLTAEQRLNETRRDRLALTNERRRNLLQGMQDQRAAIDALRVRMETEAAKLSEAGRIGTGVARLLADATPRMQVTRAGSDGVATFPVGRGDPILGGDVLEVSLPLPASGSGMDVTPLDARPAAPAAAPASSEPGAQQLSQ
ncbi:MAG: polysaccharide biosynthesis/export family protein [Pseudomonadota bacterium]